MSKRRKWSSSELTRERSLSVASKPAFTDLESETTRIRKKSQLKLPTRVSRKNPTLDRRIIINVKGKRFETYIGNVSLYKY